MGTGTVGLGAVRQAVLLALPVVVAVVGACSSAGDDGGGNRLAATTTEPGGPGGQAEEEGEVEDVEMQADDFVHLADMTPVRGFFIDNRLGHLDEAIAVAEDPDGGVYPVGTVIQLVPQEAMVKRAPGFDAGSNDWEFFSLEVTAEGTEILTRGGADVVNRFGGSCADCHGAAEPQFDFVCEDTHGCAPLPIGDDVIASVQASDPRPRR